MASLKSTDADNMKHNAPSANEARLPDSNADQSMMEEEELTIDLPDVSDIPGQENIVPPKMGMFADTTISSDGEEGTEVFGDDEQEEL